MLLICFSFGIVVFLHIPSSTRLVSPNSLAISYGYIRFVTGLRLQGLSHGITHEKSYGYVRVDTIRTGLGNRPRPVVTGLWRVDRHDPLHISPGTSLPLPGSA